MKLIHIDRIRFHAFLLSGAMMLLCGCGASNHQGNLPASNPAPLSAANVDLIFVVSDDLLYQGIGNVNADTANLTAQGLQRTLLLAPYLQQTILGNQNVTGIYALEPMTHLQTASDYPDMAALEAVQQFALMNQFTMMSPYSDMGSRTSRVRRVCGRTTPEAMTPALRRHDAILRQAIESHGGYVFKTVGDAFCAAFVSASDAVESAGNAQLALQAEDWPAEASLRVRMALHTGECEERDGDYFGPPVNRTARLEATAHGGQVVLSHTTASLVRERLPRGWGLLDLGSHRLKDLGREEQVVQLTVPGLPGEFPPLRSLDNPALANNLPAQSASFIGRAHEVAEVRDLVKASRLVTLAGAGGAGKTRLALQVAAELLDGSGDGVWLVELAPVLDPDALATTVCQALGIADRPGQSDLDTLVEVLTPQDVLVVLDNCEHLVEACAGLADAVLRRCPAVHLLATSREPLGVGGEVTYRVPSMSLPDATDDPTDGGHGLRCRGPLRQPGGRPRRGAPEGRRQHAADRVDLSPTRRHAARPRAGGLPAPIDVPGRRARSARPAVPTPDRREPGVHSPASRLFGPRSSGPTRSSTSGRRRHSGASRGSPTDSTWPRPRQCVDSARSIHSTWPIWSDPWSTRVWW